MGIQKKILYLSLALLTLFFVILLLTFTGEGEEEKRKKDQKSKALSYLLQGGGREGKAANPLGVRGEDADSIFDSDYYKSGAMKYEEEQNAIASGQEGEIPINPATGKPYPAEAMESFDELRDLFPENDLIPRRQTPELKAKQEQFNQKLSQATNTVFGGSASAADIQFYYNHVKKQGNDRLEIINYLIESQGGDDPEMDKKFNEILANIKFQNEQVDKEMNAAYQRAGVKP
ncbi:hypothetical protein EHQ58_12770 [Leptospira ognonensis]|uniref:Uncharacterized protein n=1 Tax=Leptospira ognonensis TaxID=2484945 RepID=A0A4R9JYC9_9LEPT|nr:hypothetical protein [Leptospira ognonensis]TGL58240.1 hypothetical protein EHQ58_12770 [Leptospira ognonensis]